MTMTDTAPLEGTLEDLERELSRLQAERIAKKKAVAKAEKKNKKAKKSLLKRVWEAIKRSAKWAARKAKAALRLAKKALVATGRKIKSVAKRIAGIKFVRRLWSGLVWASTPLLVAGSWVGKAVLIAGHWVGIAASWLLTTVSLGLILVVLGATLAVTALIAATYKVVQGVGLALGTPNERRSKKGKATNRVRWNVYKDGWKWRNMLPLTIKQIQIREAVREQNLRDQAESKKQQAQQPEAVVEQTPTVKSEPAARSAAQQPKGHPTPKRKTTRHHGPRVHMTPEERHGPMPAEKAKVTVPDDDLLPPF